MKILFLMSGSIACAKASGLISSLVKQGHQVKVVVTASALNFVGKATLEGLCGHKVYEATFAEGEMMEHIHLSRWADKIILAPATANVLNKLAHGIADDMLTTTWIAALQLQKPVFVAPAMNAMMWKYPATQESIQKLKAWGVKMLEPHSGELACGENDVGRMMEIEEIEKNLLSASPHKNHKKILITGGGTREFIDGVRYIGNMSSGRTSADIADFFTLQGFEVHWLGANSAIKPQQPCQQHLFDDFKDLQSRLQSLLKELAFDMVIHAAAVSDYSVETVEVEGQKQAVSRAMKLPTSDELLLSLKKNPKLIQNLKKWSSHPEITVVGFKLTNSQDEQVRQKAVAKLFKHSAVDWVAHNDLSEISKTSHPFRLFANSSEFKPCDSTLSLCHELLKIMENMEKIR